MLSLNEIEVASYILGDCRRSFTVQLKPQIHEKLYVILYFTKSVKL